MSVLSDARTRLSEVIRSQEERYAGGEDRPLRGYAATMTVYGTVVGAIAGIARATGREIPDGLSAGDVVLSAAATHKLSRLLAKDPVTSPLRAPFAAYQGTSGPSELSEEVRGHGAQKTIGELVTCPFCTGIWVATGFTAGLIYLPRTTRLAMGTLAALTGADILQFVHAWLQQTAG
ncbi:MAG: DUF1360 domain-containing protein [Streptosporangiaceae bacterium]|nr:DUF1360 domain-containing protein [Streptosporangiaceae bacterium]MBV9855938.1 DUF1360 domain-containing protein [Streptosporangiaceae bacterium]